MASTKKQRIVVPSGGDVFAAYGIESGSLTQEQQNAATLLGMVQPGVPARLGVRIGCECGLTHEDARALLECIVKIRVRTVDKLMGPERQRTVYNSSRGKKVKSGTQTWRESSLGLVHQFKAEAQEGPLGKELGHSQSGWAWPDFRVDPRTQSVLQMMEAFEQWQLDCGLLMESWVNGGTVYMTTSDNRELTVQRTPLGHRDRSAKITRHGYKHHSMLYSLLEAGVQFDDGTNLWRVNFNHEDSLLRPEDKSYGIGVILRVTPTQADIWWHPDGEKVLSIVKEKSLALLEDLFKTINQGDNKGWRHIPIPEEQPGAKE